jgi:hypothetical protein
VGDAQGKTSDHGSKAEADSSNTDPIDVETSGKQTKLEAIKRELKGDMSNIIRIILIKGVQEVGATQGEEHNISSEDL